MSLSQRLYYQNLRAMRDLTDDQLLVDLAPGEVVHNMRANILRHGLIVSAFSSLECYLVSRIDHVCAVIASKGFKYSQFDYDLQKFFLADAISGLAKKMKFLPSSDRLSYADVNIRSIATFDSAHPSFTSFGFSPQGSNIDESDISKVIKSFGIKEAWKTLGRYASQIGFGVLDLKSEFEGLARARNRSAHNPTAVVPTADTQDHIEKCILVSCCFDIVVAKIEKSIVTSADFSAYSVKVSAMAPKIWYADERLDGRWGERSSPSGPCLKIHPDEDKAVINSKSRAGVDIVIVRNRKSVPIAVVG